jgi:hypothetical protein
MTRIIFLITLFILSNSANSLVYKVKKVFFKKSKVIVYARKGSAIKKDQIIFSKEKGKKACFLKIIKVSKKKSNLAVAKFINCENFSKVKKGTILRDKTNNKHRKKIVKGKDTEEKKKDILEEQTLQTIYEGFNEEEEEWHFLVGLGYPFVSYDGSTREAIDTVQNSGASENFKLEIEAGPYFWLSGKSALVGIVFDYIIDEHSVDIDGRKTILNLNQNTLSVSYLKYYGNTIRNKFFARGDLGFSRMIFSTSVVTNSTDTEVNLVSSFFSPAFLIAGGYSRVMTVGSRVEASLSYALRKYSLKDTDGGATEVPLAANTVSLKLSFLF